MLIVHVPFTPNVAPDKLMLYPSVVASTPPQLVLPPNASALSPVGNVSLKPTPVSVPPLATGFALLIVILNWLQPCHGIVAGSKPIVTVGGAGVVLFVWPNEKEVTSRTNSAKKKTCDGASHRNVRRLCL
jgi:hypothetical protein